MSSENSEKSWTEDPTLAGIDTARLQALQSLAQKSRGKSQTEMLPFLLSLMQSNTNGGTQFSSSEADLIISAIKSGKSKQEAARIDRMVRLFHSVSHEKK